MLLWQKQKENIRIEYTSLHTNISQYMYMDNSRSPTDPLLIYYTFTYIGAFLISQNFADIFSCKRIRVSYESNKVSKYQSRKCSELFNGDCLSMAPSHTAHVLSLSS